LTSALDEGEWLASRPGRFTPRKRCPGTHWTEGWVGRRAGLDVGAKQQKSLPCPWQESKADRAISMLRVVFFSTLK